MLSLGHFTGGRDNNLQFLRLLAAAAVVLFHCYALTDRWTDEPLWKLAPEFNFGALGVKMFFVISGFLVTQSWLTRGRVDQFIIARALRIYPALIAATFWTIALAALSSQLPWVAFIGDPQTGDYLWRTALGIEVRDRLPGAFVTNPYPHAVNGSLWTLPLELRLYVGVLVAGVVGLLARRTLWLCAVAALAVVAALRAPWFAWLFHAPDLRALTELVMLFALGSLAFTWRDALPVSGLAALVAVAMIVWNPADLPRGILFAPLFTYVLLVCAYHPRLRWRAYNRVGDYSYGLYVYAFPIQQTVVQRLPGVEPLALFAYALPVSLVMAILSWHVLERPALGLKSYFD